MLLLHRQRGSSPLPGTPDALLRPSAALAALIGLLVILSPVSGCGGDDGGTKTTIHQPADFLPAGVSNWEQAGEPATGANYDALYAAIDGGAEIYIRHNLRSFAYSNYSATGSLAGASLEVLIAEMESDADVASLYEDSDLIHEPLEEILTIGNEARLTTGLTGGTFQFVRYRYFVEIEMFDSTPQVARAQLEFIATNIDREMTQ